MKRIAISFCVFLLYAGCARTFQQEFFILNYRPQPLVDRNSEAPYPFLLRIRRFDVEKIYQTHNIVYRKSPYQLQYYGFRHWAVHPSDMMTDLLTSHITAINLVNQVVHRFDDAERMADYELSGRVEAIEEYNSEDVWFAYLKYHIRVKRISDGKTIYSRHFDLRKRAPEKTPESVVRTMSQIADYTFTRLMEDLDDLFWEEYQSLDREES
ncbi:ABC-type transport auxiliary lipoprotein family protein [Chitinivibrio alkaliphilus]|uniref:ABC-type transport auxiliary lipoprotein component domain-containing protein n=1 Tax=Chitinivibrio alkaliphilus ACht1 TaxID=1313304 RepID=U7D7D0_9BACT|nr:ABC-type transport auxiliary lipoprotein family protein [Chitinivibrio alkaliphilus]ERP31486.1 hypothetical protein CALK_1530 [Chitinivibrio alkaliphilus ACht1]